MTRERNALILNRLLKGTVFFVVCLLILTIVRLVFILEFRSQDLGLVEFLPAFWVGARVDAKWLAILLIPAWLAFIVGWKYQRFYTISVVLAIFAALIMFLLDEVNFGFYGFYATPINAIVFGFVQDDTKAVIITLWKNWPIIKYIAILIVCLVVPILAAKMFTWSFKGPSTCTVIFCLVLVSLLFVIVGRGSFGKFPLRYQHFAVSTNTFVNASVVNGAAALYEANNYRTSLVLKDSDVSKLLNDVSFSSPESAEEVLTSNRKVIPASENLSLRRPHVVLVIMESMGRDLFDMDDEMNDMLGDLRPLLKTATVFRNGISIQHGTFVTLESLLLRTPLTPLTQSKYGKNTFPFSEILDFKKAGYKTIFLKGSPESWRQVDVNFRKQGFDEVFGAAYIKSKNPNIEESPWGVGDRWLFKEAFNLLEDADKKGESLFLLVVSTTNHPPYKVPDNETVGPVDASKMPKFAKPKLEPKELKSMMQTYQYASDCLADLITNMDNSGLLAKSVVAVTGDHNVRFILYEPVGYWHHNYGVPIIFWIPDEKIKAQADTKQWVSHWDIFPTLKGLALNKSEDIQLGRNLFLPDKIEGALTFNSIPGGEYGFVVGKSGAVALGKKGKMVCYHWNNDKQEKLVINSDKKCTEEQLSMGEVARAQRALADYSVRKALTDSKDPS